MSKFQMTGKFQMTVINTSFRFVLIIVTWNLFCVRYSNIYSELNPSLFAYGELNPSVYHIMKWEVHAIILLKYYIYN